MREKSLQEIMHDVAGNLEGGRFFAGCDQLFDVTHEISLLVSVDPLFASLHKASLETSSRHEMLKKMHGPHDPLVEVAELARDSAACQMETRLLELRQSRRVQKMLRQGADRRAIEREAELEYQDGQEALKRQVRQRREYHAAGIRDAEQAKKAGEDSFFFVAYLLWLMRQTLDSTQRHLSLASAFSFASGWEHGGLLYAKGKA